MRAMPLYLEFARYETRSTGRRMSDWDLLMRMFASSLSKNSYLKVPHMGWNEIEITRDNVLLEDSIENRFYFVHSYHVCPHQESVGIAVANYGFRFCAAFQQEQIFGVQFHPEKSQVWYGINEKVYCVINTLNNRVIPSLLLRQNDLVKTLKFKDPKYIGDPINAIRIFNEKEVDELLVLDIDASKLKQEPNYSLIEEFASECFMPLAYGGGITDVEQASRLFNLGVEKVVLQTGALRNLSLYLNFLNYLEAKALWFRLT